MSGTITTVEELCLFIKHHADEFGDATIATNVDVQKRIQKEATSLLAEHGLPVKMLEDMIVFQMQEGWAFACVKKSSLYGPVFTYGENEELVKKYRNLHDMMEGKELDP